MAEQFNELDIFNIIFPKFRPTPNKVNQRKIRLNLRRSNKYGHKTIKKR